MWELFTWKSFNKNEVVEIVYSVMNLEYNTSTRGKFDIFTIAEFIADFIVF